MNTRALRRLTLALGIVILVAAVVVVRRVPAETRADQWLQIAALTLGAFLLICGVITTITEPPPTAEEREQVYGLPTRAVRRSAVNTIIGLYVGFLAIVAGAVVGIATGDVGAGIQTFTYGAIVGGILVGVGVLLGHRPSET